MTLFSLCGREVGEGSSFCTNCGKRKETGSVADEGRLPERRGSERALESAAGVHTPKARPVALGCPFKVMVRHKERT